MPECTTVYKSVSERIALHCAVIIVCLNIGYTNIFFAWHVVIQLFSNLIVTFQSEDFSSIVKVVVPLKLKFSTLKFSMSTM